MSSPLEILEQQYAAEVVKVDADEELLKRLERGIRGLKGVADPAGQYPAQLHLRKLFEDSQSSLTASSVAVGWLLALVHTRLERHIASEQSQCSLLALSVA